MSQEKFINTFVELLTTTVTESIQKNLVLQAQKKVYEQEVADLKAVLLENEKSKISDHKYIMTLKEEINELKQQANNVISEKDLEHVDTFKQELVKAKKINEKMTEQMDSLSLQVVSQEQKIIELNEELDMKQKTIENLTKEIAKLLKPEVEAKIKA